MIAADRAWAIGSLPVNFPSPESYQSTTDIHLNRKALRFAAVHSACVPIKSPDPYHSLRRSSELLRIKGRLSLSSGVCDHGVRQVGRQNNDGKAVAKPSHPASNEEQRDVSAGRADRPNTAHSSRASLKSSSER